MPEELFAPTFLPSREVMEEGMASRQRIIDAIRELCQSRGESVEFIDGPLPMSGIMKVQKAKLREPHWAGHERRVG